MPKTVSFWITGALGTIFNDKKFQFHLIELKINFVIITLWSVIFSNDRKT